MGCGASRVDNVQPTSAKISEPDPAAEQSESDGPPLLTLRTVRDSIRDVSAFCVETDSELTGDLSSADIELDEYEYVRTLGSGASSVVLEMESLGVHYAVKVCDTSLNRPNFLSHDQSDPKEEAVILRRLNHPYVVKIFDFIEDAANDRLYIVMELLTGGNIEACGDLRSRKTAFTQALYALMYVHYQRLAHRDIKTDNILRHEDGSIRISDFGISEYVPEGQSKVKLAMKGTPAFQAPETFGEEPYDPFAADIWALGVTFYHVCYGRLPFVADSLVRLQRLICNEEIEFPREATEDEQRFLLSMMEKNPDKRAKLEDLVVDPFLVQKVSFDKRLWQDRGEKVYKNISILERRNSVKAVVNSHK